MTTPRSGAVWLLSFLLAGCLLAAAGPVRAQQSRHWVYLKHRAPDGAPRVSQKTMERRAQLGLAPVQETDFAPSPALVGRLAATGARPCYASRWLNAVCVEATPAQMKAIAALDFVETLSPASRLVTASRQVPAVDSMDMALALRQLGVPALRSQGLTGKGITIGLIDAGFADADKGIALQGVFANEQVLVARDFVAPGRTSFFRKDPETLDDHGTEVMSLVAGFDKEYGKLIGAATGSSFVLARTDDAITERRIEEHHWLAALEWMDSLGVQLINTSLGYALGFDDPADNHKPEDIDGKSTVVTQAVNIATQQKGIVVVVSAGNDGDDPRWRIISAPADAPDALAVGATFGTAWTKMGYSGLGPEKIRQPKPDVACYSLMGTSFAAPVITGFIACLMEKAPNQPVKRWLEVVRGSGHLHGLPNNYVGHGVPNGQAALRLLDGQPAYPDGFFTQVEVKGDQYRLPKGKAGMKNLVVFHKKDNYQVIRQQSLAGVEGADPIVMRIDGARRSTVSWPQGAIEIIWK